MTRERFAALVGWSWIIWFAGLVNVVAMLPQLIRIWRTGETAGLAMEMFILYFLIQVAFSIHGFLNRDKMLMWCLGLSALVSAITIVSVIYLRS